MSRPRCGGNCNNPDHIRKREALAVPKGAVCELWCDRQPATTKLKTYWARPLTCWACWRCSERAALEPELIGATPDPEAPYEPPTNPPPTVKPPSKGLEPR